VFDEGELSPLARMTPTQRTRADFENSNLTIGKHPMTYHRGEMDKLGVLDAQNAKSQRNGAIVKVAGCVITRQRPGTAKGFVFLTLEDETGLVNVIVEPQLFDKFRHACTSAPYVLVKGVLQSIWGVVSEKAAVVEELQFPNTTVLESHDFH
jgi:error-prone DNA polymerase